MAVVSLSQFVYPLFSPPGLLAFERSTARKTVGLLFMPRRCKTVRFWIPVFFLKIFGMATLHWCITWPFPFSTCQSTRVLPPKRRRIYFTRFHVSIRDAHFLDRPKANKFPKHGFGSTHILLYHSMMYCWRSSRPLDPFMRSPSHTGWMLAAGPEM